ncbi:GNAT family N-acetyltransferase [Syntrophomonas curvata]
MPIQYDRALEVFKRFPGHITAPGLHPDYVMADAKRNDFLTPVFFVFEAGGDYYYHGFHKTPVEGTELFDIQSPYGYGGPIASTDNKRFLARAWSEFSAWSADQNILLEFVRFHPLLNNWRYFNGEIIDNRPTVWVDLQVNDPVSLYRSRVRTTIRKALKNGLQVEWCDSRYFLQVFPPLYMAAMNALGAKPYYLFPRAYFEEMLVGDQACLAICRLNDEVLAAAVFLAGAYIMEYHLSASTAQGKSLGAGSLILHEAVSLGQQLGCQVLHLGGGTDSSPDNALLFFKAGFSQVRARFKIGKKIYRKEQYEQMRNEYRLTCGETPHRVIFYR